MDSPNKANEYGNNTEEHYATVRTISKVNGQHLEFVSID